MLQVCLHQAAVPSSPQPEGAHTLGECALDASSACIAVSTRLGLIPLASRRQCRLLGLRQQLELPCLVWRARTQRAGIAGITIRLTEHDHYPWADHALGQLAPIGRELALRTTRRFVFPIDVELLNGVSPCRLVLPTWLVSGRAT